MNWISVLGLLVFVKIAWVAKLWSQPNKSGVKIRGQVFRGRFKSISLDKKSYLLELASYILLNPARTGMARWVHR